MKGGQEMYNKILVPLDGSKLAECALPYAEELARGCGTEEVILVSVTERIQGFRVLEGEGQPIAKPTGGWVEPRHWVNDLYRKHSARKRSKHKGILKE
jgi:nucleotide-binding universal stress UspA family protein